MRYSIANELRKNPFLLPEQVIGNHAGMWKRLDTRRYNIQNAVTVSKYDMC